MLARVHSASLPHGGWNGRETLRLEAQAQVLALSPAERYTLAHRLGEEDARRHAAAHGLSIEEARRRLSAARAVGRRPSCAQALDQGS